MNNTADQQHDFDSGTLNSEMLLPEKPIEPLDSECCGTGCSPCVFDIYKKQLTRWEKECESIRRTGVFKLKNGDSVVDSEVDIESGITPYEYKLFKVVEILQDSVDSVKIFKFDSNPVTSSIHCSKNTIFTVDIGQHVVIKMDQISRKYTVLRVTRTFDSCHFEILIKIYPEGPMTQLLNQLSIGSNLNMRGPFGQRYEYKQDVFQTIVMLVAGTGFAPMYRIIENILDNECDDTRIKLLFSCKNVEEVFLQTKLRYWESFWNFHVFYYFSSQSASKAVPYGMSAKLERLDSNEILEKCSKELSGSPKSTQFLICGTKSFEKDMINYLQKLNVNSNFVHVF